MSHEYSEDSLIEPTAIQLFYQRLGWNTAFAYNKESFGEGSSLGRQNKKQEKFISTNILNFFVLLLPCKNLKTNKL